ncbi:MAG TPA: ATP-binding protein [Patescibacteria group bacterium]|nr:ATP-binding protein [Patescibacteria group bacterium]
MRPILFYTVGLPGAGKSTFARQLAFLLGGKVLRGDVIGLELFRLPTYSPEERKMVYAEMSRRATTSLRAGEHVFYDAATNTQAQREAVVALAEQNGAEALGVWIETPIAIAKRRAASPRDKGVAGRVVRIIPPHIFDQYAAAFELPDDNEVIVQLSGTAPFFLQYRRLYRYLRAQGIRPPRLVN